MDVIRQSRWAQEVDKRFTNMKINWTNVAEEAIGATISAGFIAFDCIHL